ncbi:MAG: YrrS family protein [Bacillota bacterium]|nr:YrrS family protein [Bacillota bacterium]
MKNDFQGSSRANYRAKRKKTNLVLNGLIGIVLLLIVFVAYSIFLSGNDKTAANKDGQTTAAKTTTEKKSVNKTKNDTSSDAKNTTTQNSSKENNNQVVGDQANTAASSSTSKDNQTNSDQQQTVNGPDANTTAPASSTQHVTSYDSNSQDWQQMLQTMSSAAGIDQGNMTVWFLGSDKSTPGGSVGTISAKDNKGQKFRVYLQWDGQGYKATKVEQVQ